MRSFIKISFVVLLFSASPLACAQNQEIALKQNQTSNFATKEWIEKIRVSGLIMGEMIASNQDAGSGARFSTSGSKSYSTFCFPRASLYVDGDISQSIKAHMSLNFAPSKMSNSCSACGFGRKNDEMRFNKYGIADEVYVTLADLKESPYYARGGIQYVPYGYYIRNMIPASLPQLMTQTQGAGIAAGYANNDNGMNLALFSFSGKKKRNGATKIDNFGGQVGYIKSTEEYDTQVTLGIMNNIAGSVNYIVSSTPTCCGKEQNILNKGYRKRVAGSALTLRHETTRWDATMQFTSAMSKFHKDDVMWKRTGARPAAGLVDLGYKFTAFGERKNRIGASCQMSAQALNIRGNGNGAGLPKQRVQADYTIEIEPYVEVGAHVFWDKDYGKKDGGTGKNATTLLLTLAVKLG